MNLNPGDSAFPGVRSFGIGLTKREYMATQILAGIFACPTGVRDAAKAAVRAADLLIEALNFEGLEDKKEKSPLDQEPHVWPFMQRRIESPGKCCLVLPLTQDGKEEYCNKPEGHQGPCVYRNFKVHTPAASYDATLDPAQPDTDRTTVASKPNTAWCNKPLDGDESCELPEGHEGPCRALPF